MIDFATQLRTVNVLVTKTSPVRKVVLTVHSVYDLQWYGNDHTHMLQLCKTAWPLHKHCICAERLFCWPLKVNHKLHCPECQEPQDARKPWRNCGAEPEFERQVCFTCYLEQAGELERLRGDLDTDLLAALLLASWYGTVDGLLLPVGFGEMLRAPDWLGDLFTCTGLTACVLGADLSDLCLLGLGERLCLRGGVTDLFLFLCRAP